MTSGRSSRTKTSDITIRLAPDFDVADISSLLHESFAEYESLYNPQGFAVTASPSEQVSDRIAEGPVWVAVRDKHVVGTVSVIPKGDTLYIRGMAVLPIARGQRTGDPLFSMEKVLSLKL